MIERGIKMVPFDICEGNPGALQFLMQAYDIDPFRAERCFRRMRGNGISGSKLYMLWNDCCGRDTEKTMDIMEGRGIDEIKCHINYDGGRGIPFEDMTGSFSKSLLNLIATHRVSVRIEQSSLDGFAFTVERSGLFRRIVIRDREMSYTTELDDYLIHVIKGIVHELLSEEQKRMMVSRQFIKRDMVVEEKVKGADNENDSP